MDFLTGESTVPQTTGEVGDIVNTGLQESSLLLLLWATRKSAFVSNIRLSLRAPPAARIGFLHSQDRGVPAVADTVLYVTCQ